MDYTYQFKELKRKSRAVKRSNFIGGNHVHVILLVLFLHARTFRTGVMLFCKGGFCDARGTFRMENDAHPLCKLGSIAICI